MTSRLGPDGLRAVPYLGVLHARVHHPHAGRAQGTQGACQVHARRAALLAAAAALVAAWAVLRLATRLRHLHTVRCSTVLLWTQCTSVRAPVQ